MVVPGSLREVVGLSSKFPGVSQLTRLQGHDLLCACVTGAGVRSCAGC